MTGASFPAAHRQCTKANLCEGNIKTQSLQEMIERYQYTSIFSQLTRHKFGWLLKKAKEHGIAVSEESHSPCSFCHEVFCNPEFAKQLKKDVWKERITSVLTE